MSTENAATVLAAIRDQQNSHPLTILHLAESIRLPSSTKSEETPDLSTEKDSEDPASTQNGSNTENPTPQSLNADLAHYRDLFSKLRFSYIEQVTKEKYLKSIVGDPPLLVSHAENQALEERLATMKAQLKAKKVETENLVRELETTASELAKKYEKIQKDSKLLDRLPAEIETLRQQVEELKGQLAEKEGAMEISRDPRMNMSLDATNQALEEQRRRNQELDEQIEALQKQLPRKMQECERLDRELEDLDRKKNESTRVARELRRMREEGGRDPLEEQGKWYKSSEIVLKGLLGMEA